MVLPDLKRLVLRLQKFLLPLAVLLTAVSLQLWQPYPVEFTRNLVFDQYNRWQPRAEGDSPVVFVDIDEASLARLGQFPGRAAICHIGRENDRLWQRRHRL